MEAICILYRLLQPFDEKVQPCSPAFTPPPHHHHHTQPQIVPQGLNRPPRPSVLRCTWMIMASRELSVQQHPLSSEMHQHSPMNAPASTYMLKDQVCSITCVVVILFVWFSSPFFVLSESDGNVSKSNVTVTQNIRKIVLKRSLTNSHSVLMASSENLFLLNNNKKRIKAKTWNPNKQIQVSRQKKIL